MNQLTLAFIFMMLIGITNLGLAQNIADLIQSDCNREQVCSISKNTNPMNWQSTASAPQELNSICFDSSRNGYGWSGSTHDPSTYSYQHNTISTTYRKFLPGSPQTGWGGLLRYYLADPFEYGNLVITELAQGITYPLQVYQPIMLATDTATVTLLAENNTAIARLMLVINPWDYLQMPFPSLKLIELTWPAFFPVSADIIQKPNGSYLIGVIGERLLNSGNYALITLSSADGIDWAVADSTTLINSNQLETNAPVFAWGKNGFAAWAASGFLNRGADSTYKLIYNTSNDYGQSWNLPTPVAWNTLGIPQQITTSDSIYIPDPNSTGDSLLYTGEAFVGLTYQYDLICDAQNQIHFGSTIQWGQKLSGIDFYPHRRWSGIYDLHNQTAWQASRISTNAGLLGSDASESVVILNEIKLAKDEQNNIYAAWLDRDRQNIVPSPYPRSNSNILSHYNLDVWASRSLDGGMSWSEIPVRVTDNQQVCHYGLKLTPRVKTDTQNNGRIMLNYQIADLSRPLAPPVETLTDHAQWLYIAEAKNFPPAVSIDAKYVKNKITGLKLYPNYPNPFNPESNIRFHLPKPENVKLEIYNLVGQKVRTLFSGNKPASEHSVLWNGQDDLGNSVASGVYVYRLSNVKYNQSNQLLLIR